MGFFCCQAHLSVLMFRHQDWCYPEVVNKSTVLVLCLFYWRFGKRDQSSHHNPPCVDSRAPVFQLIHLTENSHRVFEQNDIFPFFYASQFINQHADSQRPLFCSIVPVNTVCLMLLPMRDSCLADSAVCKTPRKLRLWAPAVGEKSLNQTQTRFFEL